MSTFCWVAVTAMARQKRLLACNEGNVGLIMAWTKQTDQHRRYRLLYAMHSITSLAPERSLLFCRTFLYPIVVPLVLGHCWLGVRKSTRPVKN